MDIEKRLREAHPNSQQYALGSSLLLDAADEIATLRAELARYQYAVNSCEGGRLDGCACSFPPVPNAEVNDSQPAKGER